MAQTPEGIVKRKIKAMLDAAGAYHCSPVGAGYGNSGVPDIIACVHGMFLAIEAKAGKGTTTALQKQHIGNIQTAGGVALVINETNLHELKEAIECLKQLRGLRQ